VAAQCSGLMVTTAKHLSQKSADVVCDIDRGGVGSFGTRRFSIVWLNDLDTAAQTDGERSPASAIRTGINRRHRNLKIMEQSA